MGEDGKFAVITNYRGLPEDMDCGTEYRSRGDLALSYLKSGDSPDEHAAKLRQTKSEYKGNISMVLVFVSSSSREVSNLFRI